MTALLISTLALLLLWPTISFAQSMRPHGSSSYDIVSNLSAVPAPRSSFGLHDTPIIGGSSDLDRAFRDWEDLNVSWITVLDAREELLRRANQAGITVINRVYSRSIFEPGDLRGDTRRMVRYGMRYVIPYNEPNLIGENAGRTPDPIDFAQRWIAAAEVIHAEGGYPVLTPLAPEGDHPDVDYFQKYLGAVVAAKGAQWLLDYHVAVGVHSYILRPTDSYLGRFQTYDSIVRQVVGQSLPMLGTEGGVVMGKEHPSNTADVALAKTLEIVKQVQQPDWPRHILAATVWLYSNKAQGGHDDQFEQYAWLGQRGPQPVFQEVMLRFGPRLDPDPSTGLLIDMTP
ncbi:MAG: hypothetical protein EPO21_09475 [Chloroflexota bacterium]|nr:MAG: hypothetical protein EPO21_09475 [Chloroflexota bacterium]